MWLFGFVVSLFGFAVRFILVMGKGHIVANWSSVSLNECLMVKKVLNMGLSRKEPKKSKIIRSLQQEAICLNEKVQKIH